MVRICRKKCHLIAISQKLELFGEIKTVAPLAIWLECAYIAGSGLRLVNQAQQVSETISAPRAFGVESAGVVRKEV